MKKRVPFFYTYVHYMIYRNMKGEVSKKDVENYLFQWRIPNNARTLIIDELASFNLLKKKNRFMIVLNKPKINPNEVKYFKQSKINFNIFSK